MTQNINIMAPSGVKDEVQKLANPEKAQLLSRFFKTGKGEYGEGDVFAGLSVPQSRKVAQKYKNLDREGISELLSSPIHEERLIALLILVAQYRRASDTQKKSLADFYLEHRKYVNNWDLVDSSAPYILGNWLLMRDRKILYDLAVSASLWDRRIAILSTFAFIRAGEFEDTFAIAALLLNDREDLIHKATGWMLREVGKRIGMDILRGFLASHAAMMPRTALRYAIEKMPEEERKQWLKVCRDDL